MIRPFAWLLSAGLLAGCQNVQQPTYDPFAGRALPPPAFRGQPTPATPYYTPGAPAPQPNLGAPPAFGQTAPPNNSTWTNRSAPAVNPPATSPAVAQPTTPAQPYTNPGAYGAPPATNPPTNAYPAGPTTGLPPRTPYGAQPAPTFRPTSNPANPYPSQPVTIPPDMPGAGDGRTASRPITIPREAWETPTTVTVRKPPLPSRAEGLTPEDVPYDVPGAPRRAGEADAPRLPPTKPAAGSPSQQALGRSKSQEPAAVADSQPFPWKLPTSKPAPQATDSGIRLVGFEEEVEEPKEPAAKPATKSSRRLARLKPEQVVKDPARPRRIMIDTVPAKRSPIQSGIVTAVAEDEGDGRGSVVGAIIETERLEPRTVAGPTVRNSAAPSAVEPLPTVETIDPPTKTPAVTETPKALVEAADEAPAEKPVQPAKPEPQPVQETPAESPSSDEPPPSPAKAKEPPAAKIVEAEAPPEDATPVESTPGAGERAPSAQESEPAEKAETPEEPEEPAPPARPAPEKPAQPPQRNAANQKAYDHAEDYAWLRGQVEYLEAESCWKLRYIPFDGDTDQYGGSVVLRNLPATARLKRGETITVRGKLTRDKPTAAGFAPYYQVQSVER